MSTFGILLAGFLTLAIFSFLYKDNPIYRLAEHIFAGLSAGYYVGLVWQSVIIQQLADPISQHWAAMQTGAGGSGHVGQIIMLIIAGVLGVLMFARFFPNMSWISRYPLAFVMGITAGIYLTSELHGRLLAQVSSTFIDLLNPLNIIIFVGVVTTLIYFYFSKEHVGALGVGARVGIWFIMVAFGAHFGYTVMARISLLIGRVQFLFIDCKQALLGLFS
ncbi:MAG: hypothetical protein IT585_02410 [candidate division Zixibacteria bacterium]|nr:hypothetical protein [candidate division Zixibacteria bacterium]